MHHLGRSTETGWGGELCGVERIFVSAARCLETWMMIVVSSFSIQEHEWMGHFTVFNWKYVHPYFFFCLLHKCRHYIQCVCKIIVWHSFKLHTDFTDTHYVIIEEILILKFSKREVFLLKRFSQIYFFIEEIHFEVVYYYVCVWKIHVEEVLYHMLILKKFKIIVYFDCWLSIWR